MKYIIIEDEVPARQLLESIVTELRPDWELAGGLDSVESAVSWLSSNEHPDIIFLDIQLSDGLGFDVLEQVEIRSMIIFTTAYNEYAIRAFEVNSIDYLLKPIKKSRMEQALVKYESLTGNMFRQKNTSFDISQIVSAIRESKPNYRERFLVTQGETFIPLPVEEVSYFFSRNKIISAVTGDGRRHIIDIPLDRLEEQLNPSLFFRASRQFMVSINAVYKVHTFFNGKLILETRPAHDEKITISRDKARAFKLWLDR